MRFKTFLAETTLPKEGDRVLTGKFRNRKGTIKKIDKDEKGDVTVTIKLDDSLTKKGRVRKGKRKVIKLFPFRLIGEQ